MKKLFIIVVLFMLVGQVWAQKNWTFGLQTGATVSTFQTYVTVDNANATTIPPINELDYSTNFQIGFWFEKQITRSLTLRWEVQRSPGGAKAFDMVENRQKRYKFFYLNSPLLLKLTPFQQQWHFPVQVEVGASVNLFLFDYGEAVTFGDTQQVEYSAVIGLTKAIDEKWTIGMRYIRGLTPFSQYDSNDLNIDWRNRMVAINLSRVLFTLKKKA